MICAIHSRRRLALAAAVALSALALRFDGVRSAEAPTQGAARHSPNEANAPAETVTIEARRQREIKHQINQFVSGAVFTYLNDSLERWDSPICPLVAGLPRERGEFILQRVSQIARDSHAPLGPEHCKPNLYVVVSENPDLLLQKWSARDRRLFNTCNGAGYVKEFLHSRQPVRAYYNATFSYGGVDGDAASALELQGVHFNFSFSECMAAGGGGTRLRYGAVQKLTSVVIVVDSRRTTNINMGQLADYIAMVGLAQIRVEADTGTAPTILTVFREAAPQPRGLSPWDQAFLASLYTTDQSSVLQVTSIKRRMFEQIIGR